MQHHHLATGIVTQPSEVARPGSRFQLPGDDAACPKPFPTYSRRPSLDCSIFESAEAMVDLMGGLALLKRSVKRDADTMAIDKANFQAPFAPISGFLGP